MAWEIGAYEYVSTGTTVQLSGQDLTVSQGSITVTGVTVTVTLTGQDLTVSQGSPTVTTGVVLPLSGQDLTTSQGTITVDTGTAGLIITDVDGDETIANGQTGVVATLSGPWAASGKRVWLDQSGNRVEQSVTGETTSSVTFNVTFGGVLVPGAATLYVANPM